MTQGEPSSPDLARPERAGMPLSPAFLPPRSRGKTFSPDFRFPGRKGEPFSPLLPPREARGKPLSPGFGVPDKEGKSLSPTFASPETGGKLVSFPPAPRKKEGRPPPSLSRLTKIGERGFPSFFETRKASAAAPDNSFEAPAVHPELRDGHAVAQKDRDDVREAFPEIGLGVHVSRRPGKAVGRQDFVEQKGHLVAEMTSPAGHELITGVGNGAAEEHGGRITAPSPRRAGGGLGRGEWDQYRMAVRSLLTSWTSWKRSERTMSRTTSAILPSSRRRRSLFHCSRSTWFELRLRRLR